MKKIKVYMGIPSMGERVDFQTYVLRAVEKRYTDEIELVYPEQCCHRFMHCFARNEIVEEFLNSDCDYLWFLDADVVPPDHILDLITIHGKKDWLAAGAPYPLWLGMPGTGELGVQYTVYNGKAPTGSGQRGFALSTVPRSGTEWVDGLATGCLLLKRELFTKLEKPYFQFKRIHENQEVIEGEDLGFAMKLSNLGIKFFVDHSMVCGHWKRVNLLDVQNYATAWVNAKLNQMHEEIKDQVTHAVKSAAAQGYKRGKEDALKGVATDMPNVQVVSPGTRKTSSGLILPT